MLILEAHFGSLHGIWSGKGIEDITHSLRFIPCLPIVQFSCWGTADGNFQTTWMCGGNFWWPSAGRFDRTPTWDWCRSMTSMRRLENSHWTARAQLKDMLYTLGWSWCLQHTGWFLKSCRQSLIQWAFVVLRKDFGSYATKTISGVAKRFLTMKMQGLFTSPRNSQAPCFSVCCWALGIIATLNMWSLYFLVAHFRESSRVDDSFAGTHPLRC